MKNTINVLDLRPWMENNDNITCSVCGKIIQPNETVAVTTYTELLGGKILPNWFDVEIAHAICHDNAVNSAGEHRISAQSSTI